VARRIGRSRRCGRAARRARCRCLDQACRHLRCRANPTLTHDQILQPSPLQVSLDAGCPSRPWSNLPWPAIPAILSRPSGGFVIDLHFCRRHAARTVFGGQAAQHGFAVVRLGAERGCGDAGRYRTSLPPASDARPATLPASREEPGPAPPQDEIKPGPVTRFLPHPADVTAQHRVLVPEHRAARRLRNANQWLQPDTDRDGPDRQPWRRIADYLRLSALGRRLHIKHRSTCSDVGLPRSGARDPRSRAA